MLLCVDLLQSSLGRFARCFVTTVAEPRKAHILLQLRAFPNTHTKYTMAAAAIVSGGAEARENLKVVVRIR
jgi:hypothetical protein